MRMYLGAGDVRCALPKQALEQNFLALREGEIANVLPQILHTVVLPALLYARLPTIA